MHSRLKAYARATYGMPVLLGVHTEKRGGGVRCAQRKRRSGPGGMWEKTGEGGGQGGGARGAHAPAAGPAPCSYTFRTHQRSVGAQMWGLPNTTRHSPSGSEMEVRDAAPLAYRPLPVPACGLCHTNGEQSRINPLRNGTSSASAPSPTQHPKPARSSVCHMSPKAAHTTVGVPHTDRAITGTGHNSAPVGGETGANHERGMPLKCGEGFPCDKTHKTRTAAGPPAAIRLSQSMRPQQTNSPTRKAHSRSSDA